MDPAEICKGWAQADRFDGTTIRTRESPGDVRPANRTLAGSPPTLALTFAATGNAPENT